MRPFLTDPAPREGIAIEMEPGKFYALADMITKVSATARPVALDAFSSRLDAAAKEIDDEVESLAKANKAMLAEIRQTTRRRNPLLPPDDDGEDIFADLRHTSGGQNFLRVIFDVMKGIQLGFRAMKALARECRPGTLMLVGKRVTQIKTIDDLQALNMEVSLNKGTITRFVNGLLSVERARAEVVNLGRLLAERLDGYYQVLLDRHSVQGIEIHGDPVVTDIAMSIFENVDAHGEISEDGKKPDELSAYSMRKAQIMADAVRRGMVDDFVKNPDHLIEYLTRHLQAIWDLTEMLDDMYREQIRDLRVILEVKDEPRGLSMSKAAFFEAIEMLKDLDPRTISFKEKTGLLTPEERYELRFRNTTLATIAAMLRGENTSDELIQYILDRKAEWRRYLTEENSFYVCKTSAGNPFTGEAPGELKVIPGTRPNIRMDEILGSGFDEVRAHFETVEASAEWYDLFVATSPSKSGDKSHVLLVGPQGCGKSEVFRAVGGDKKSVGIFATGSDFLTCWKGEAEKNPKRLFEAAIKLQRDANKHVHIMIDEIDTILNKDSGRDAFGNTNLVTEFQNLMDGVVHYPHISVWGATNHPDRMPMPCIRRFSKVLIVGELTQADRVTLLKGFAGHMAMEPIADHLWDALAKKLEGATGDVLRKVVDHVWRTKMTAFVHAKPAEAKKVLASLANGTKFSIAEFTAEKRAAFHAVIREHKEAVLTGDDLARSIDQHLDNVAIHNEIKTAVDTYTKARAFLSAIQAKRVQNGAAQVAEA